ncbi:MAG TPA: aldehyde dehydrogenase family protein [Acidimicrobiales bacterium]|jgi:succinate-semialdehyde dehydrogenase/glutarate-semialdehyde dehydrogenase|nr:aldehyde dehydrogenase family protein [Acidimicrobiales bacterium]
MSPVDAGPPIATISPVTGELLQSFEPYDAAGVERRLAAADSAAAQWATSTFSDRSRLLTTAAELLEGELPDIAHVITTEMGKPFAQAKAEVAKCAAGFRWFAEHSEQLLTDEEVPVDASLGLITYQPLGAILAIMPWNFPLWQVTRFLAPAIMVGNVGLLKHAPSVPRTALLLEDLFRRSGAPDGVFQTLLVGTDQVPAIIADPRVAAVTLTGSVGAGRAVAAQAGAVGKKIVLELGGSDPFIVLPSADLDRAVSVGVQARVQNAGQSCIAAKRFIVHRDVAEAFTAGFVAGIDALSVGDPFDPATEVGPLVTASARDIIEAQVEDARSHGASILCGGERVIGPGGVDHPGFFYRPTVITGITPAMRVATEEVFGPVALLYTAADADEALALANGTEFGLGSSVWTTDPDEQQRFVTGLQAGQVFVNGMVVSMPELPFGGIKSSGVGRELAAFGLHEFCNVKSVWVA